MRAAVGAALAMGLLAHAADMTMIDDFFDQEFEDVDVKLGLQACKAGDTCGEVSDDADGAKKAVFKVTRQDANNPFDRIKFHFRRFWVPAGCKLIVSNPDGSESYKYGKFAGDDKTVDVRSGEDGGESFAALSIDGETAHATLHCPQEAVAEWNDDLHGVVLGRIELARNIALRDTQGRHAKTLSKCGHGSERIDISCHAQKYPTEVRKGAAVARLYIGHAGGVCTAWRVSADNLMLTNNHCFKEQWELSSCEIQFNYQRTCCGCGGRADAGSVKSSLNKLLRTDATLDFSLFTLSDQGWNTIQRYNYGYMTLEPRAPQVGERIYIPQHGAGDPKQLAITDDTTNDFCKITTVRQWGSTNNLGYTCDTVGGSSGSPVMLAGTHKAIGLHNTGGCSASGGSNGGIKIEKIWPLIKGYFDGSSGVTGPGTGGGGSTWTPPPPAPAPIATDCQGYWGTCNADCAPRYMVTKSAANGGDCPPASAYSRRPACNNGDGECRKGCQPSCSGKDCGPDGCGGTCGNLGGACYSGDECKSGVCTARPPPPAPAPAGGPPSCSAKACNYKLGSGGNCPAGFERIGSSVYGCDSSKDECEYGFAEALRENTQGTTSFDPPKTAYAPWTSGLPARCSVLISSATSMWLVWDESYSPGSGVGDARVYAVCRKSGFAGPGCARDTAGSTPVCTPSCFGKTCGDDGCGGACGPGCVSSETCDANTGRCVCTPQCAGKSCGPDGCGGSCGDCGGVPCDENRGVCQEPLCGKYASVCDQPGLKVIPDKPCTRKVDGNQITYTCSSSQCCTDRTCAADAECDSEHVMVDGAATSKCHECQGDTKTVNPTSCCLPKNTDPAQPTCPPNEWSDSLCNFIASNGYCVPGGQYVGKCMTTCYNSGYKVCGKEIMNAVSLAAGRDDSAEGGGSGGDVPTVAVVISAIGALVCGLAGGLFIARKTR